MKVTDSISLKIDRLPMGYVFTYEDFSTEVKNKEAIIKALNRMAALGRISKISKGKFYKPESTPFGNILPDQYQVVKDLLENNGKIIGYLTGTSIYNQLGLTTQVSYSIQIGKNAIRPSLKRERYSINFIKQNNTINKENIPMLQLLDAIRYIKKIPDSTIESSCRRLTSIFRNLTDIELSTLVRLALKYPPSSRALAGALIDEINRNVSTETLNKSLNPITRYKWSGINNSLSFKTKWNIQ